MSIQNETDELDLTSPNFNPMKALYSDHVKVPCPNAPIYDNVSCFIETPEGILPKPPKLRSIRERDKKEIKKITNESSTESLLISGQQSNEIVKQLPKKLRSNILTRMENTVKGPLTFLKKCMDEKLRIKVYIRGPVDIRGFCFGFVEAFDKHWNLVLKDVFEMWSRKKKKKLYCLGPSETPCDKLCKKSVFETDEINVLLNYKYKFYKNVTFENEIKTTEHKLRSCSKTVVRERLGRKEVCERHIDQLLIRGEQIIIITLDSFS